MIYFLWPSNEIGTMRILATIAIVCGIIFGPLWITFLGCMTMVLSLYFIIIGFATK